MTGKELRALRLRLDLTQREMAEKLGASLSMYSLYERGITPMRKSMAILCRRLTSKEEFPLP